MILDSSAVVAVMRGEPGAEAFAALVAGEPHVGISAATFTETSIVLGPAREPDLDEWLEVAEADIVPFDAEQARIARHAYARYGRGSGSPARLNLGDCFSYALAKATGRPLLFTGADFVHTDLEPAFPTHP